MTKLYSLIGGLLFMFFGISSGQVGVGTTDIDPSAVLELKSTTKGFLMPRMTTSERNLIATPEEGLMVYNTDRGAMQFFRKNIGTSGTQNGWYDSRCNGDIATAIASFPGGLTLDFSDLNQNGKFYPNTNGGGTAFSSSTPNGTPFKSIGPIPLDITGANTGNTYINYVAGAGSPETPTDVYVLSNNDVANNYNAATFASRNIPFSSSVSYRGHGMSADLVPDYSDNFDIVLVAKFDVKPTAKNESFFNIGEGGTTIQLGVGETSGTCTKGFFAMQIGGKRLCGATGDFELVAKDTLFHRFRIKYTNNGNTGTNEVEYYMDGNLMDEFIGTEINNITIEELTLFTNKSKRRFPASSIAFLGVYPVHLTQANFEALDRYLACKFEAQP